MTKTLTLQSQTPMSATYVDLTNYNLVSKAGAALSTVRRSSAVSYNHLKKVIEVRDQVLVPGVCTESACIVAPVVLRIEASAPEGVDLGPYTQLLLNAQSIAGPLNHPIVTTAPVVTDAVTP